MNYYAIDRSDNLKIIGHYPQTSLTKNYNPTLPNSHRNVKIDIFPDFLPNYELELHPKAIATSFLPKVDLSFGLIIDEKVKQILEKVHLPSHAFYPIKVHHNNHLLNYYWFHYIIDDFWYFLDKQSSYAEHKVFVDSLTTKVKSKIPIISREQIINEKTKIQLSDILAIGNIKMKKDFPKYDLYEIGCLSYNTIISELLRELFIKEGITGFETRLYDKFETTD